MEPLQPDDPRRIGPYRVVARLGAGGMGVVYLGRSRGGRPVAVKVVHRRFVGEDRYRARFRREVGAARAVAGAFTAPVLDADPDAPTPWLATAYLPGPSLREAVAGFGPLPPDALRALAAGLAEALAAIHRAGLVHRDLKPGNVLLTAGGPRVIDFGIARPDGATAITRAGAPIGTAGYMGPEQVRGERVGPPGDVFALGATLAYAATGVEPFGTGAAHARQSRVLAGEADLGAVPGPWPRDLVAACLRPEPSARPSAAELLDALGRTGPDEPSLQGVGWLPAPVAAEVERRAAE
ncbi:serine/threonine-protein kinase, partial [Actinomadura sediminis]